MKKLSLPVGLLLVASLGACSSQREEAAALGGSSAPAGSAAGLGPLAGAAQREMPPSGGGGGASAAGAVTGSEPGARGIALDGSGGVPMGSAGAAGRASDAGAPGNAEGPDPRFLVFLLLGQSNMVGQPQPESADLQRDPRIEVLAYEDCPSLGRAYNQWYTASPPLHGCDAGVGPGDHFARTLIQSLPDGYTIGLVPFGVNGAPIDVFRKGVPRPGWELPPDNHWETGYEWIMSRAQEAQKAGVIAGILFHQGESNNQAPDWVGNVAGLVTDLRADLGIGGVPFLAGELYYEGCCGGHNALVAELVGSVPNAFLVSAAGLSGFDQFHFDLPSQRELGGRFAAVMQRALRLP